MKKVKSLIEENYFLRQGLVNSNNNLIDKKKFYQTLLEIPKLDGDKYQKIYTMLFAYSGAYTKSFSKEIIHFKIKPFYQQISKIIKEKLKNQKEHK